MVEDFSLIHETLAYAAYRGAGACRLANRLCLRARQRGTTSGSTSTSRTWTTLRWNAGSANSANPQHLYEGESGADVTPGVEALPAGDGGFEVDEGDRRQPWRPGSAVAAVNSTEGEGWSAAVAPVADLTELTRMWAVEKYIGHWDGYAGQAGKFQPNNYFLYSDPSGVFQMLPWGTDETWERRPPPSTGRPG